MRNTFLQWLKTQTHRADPVGDLARDLCQDRGRAKPRRPGATHGEWLTYLRSCNASDGAIAVFETAWNLYREDAAAHHQAASATETAFLAAWHARQLPPATATDLLPLTAAARLELRAASVAAQRSRLGLWLAKRRGVLLRTPAGDFIIASAGIYLGRQRWQIDAVVAPTPTKESDR